MLIIISQQTTATIASHHRANLQQKLLEVKFPETYFLVRSRSWELMNAHARALQRELVMLLRLLPATQRVEVIYRFLSLLLPIHKKRF